MAPPAVSGPLSSELLRGNNRLQQCAQRDSQHVQPGEPPSDHVRLIQEALRQVFGSDIPAAEKDYGEFTTKAVIAFKTDRKLFTRGSAGTIDPIVGMGTISTLDALLQTEDDLRRRRGRGAVAPQIIVRPDGHIPGETDHFGFSAARLAHSGSGQDWTRRDPARPICQYIPVGGRRKLIVEATDGVNFRIDGEHFASIDSSDQRSITLRGNAPGHALLTLSAEGSSLIKVDVVVRAATRIPVDVFHLGPSRVPGAAATFQAQVLPAINLIYASQTNITFTPGTTRDITVMVMGGHAKRIDMDMPLFFSSIIGPPLGTRATMRFEDLEPEVRNPGAVTCFIAPNIRDEANPAVLGRGGLRTRICWFKTGFLLSDRIVPAHEIGHSLGLPHITAGGSVPYLMHEHIAAFGNNTVIPSETLDDLII